MRGKGEVVYGGKQGVTSSEMSGKKGGTVTGRCRVEGRIFIGGEEINGMGVCKRLAPSV